MQETSLQAYDEMKKKLTERQKKVRDILQGGPCTLFEIARFVNLPEHSLSGRLTELAELQVIEDSGERRKNPRTGRNAIVWRLRATRSAGIPQPLFR